MESGLLPSAPGLAEAAESVAVDFLLMCRECTPPACSRAQFFGAMLETLSAWNMRPDAKKDEWKRLGQAFLSMRASGVRGLL